MITETEDLLGNVVKVGDRVAVALRDFNLAELRVGTVVAFGVVNSYGGPDDTIRVEWEKSSNYSYAAKTSGVSVSKKRFVRIT